MSAFVKGDKNGQKKPFKEKKPLSENRTEPKKERQKNGFLVSKSGLSN